MKILLCFQVNCAEKGPATIVLANIRYTDLENILHFIYRGQVNVKKEDLNNFLETGEQLQIDGLVGQGQSKQGSSAVKRRFSEGGQVLGRASAQQHGHGSHLVNRGGHRGSTQPHQTQYKIVAGNTSRMSSASSGSQNNHSNHTENHVKKARISPTISSASVVKAESVIANASARRPSTSSSVLQNSTTSPSHAAAGKSEEVDHEVCENNGIKILAVASINSASGNAGYDAQGNDVFEILDYEDDDRPENDMEGMMHSVFRFQPLNIAVCLNCKIVKFNGFTDSELMGSYCEGGEDGLYYAYQQSSPTYGRTPNSQGFSLPSRPLVSARYPSIIDGVHFDLISADEKRVAAQCKLCPGEKIIRGSGLTSSNFISHLRV